LEKKLVVCSLKMRVLKGKSKALFKRIVGGRKGHQNAAAASKATKALVETRDPIVDEEELRLQRLLDASAPGSFDETSCNADPDLLSLEGDGREEEPEVRDQAETAPPTPTPRHVEDVFARKNKHLIAPPCLRPSAKVVPVDGGLVGYIDKEVDKEKETSPSIPSPKDKKKSLTRTLRWSMKKPSVPQKKNIPVMALGDSFDNFSDCSDETGYYTNVSAQSGYTGFTYYTNYSAYTERSGETKYRYDDDEASVGSVRMFCEHLTCSDNDKYIAEDWID
jgi:hypothetical protein